MFVDSTALLEQLTDDVMRSAFGSAGQRCSALRVLLLQDDVAEPALAMLTGAMRELRVGDPADLATDVGPLIDDDAVAAQAHIAAMRGEGCRIDTVALPDRCANGSFLAPHIVEIDDFERFMKNISARCCTSRDSRRCARCDDRRGAAARFRSDDGHSQPHRLAGASTSSIAPRSAIRTSIAT